jgi:hypothetical protein
VFVTARRALAGLAAAALVAGLAGCSGGGKPTTLPSLTANTSLSPTPTATNKAAEMAAVSAVVHQWFRLIDGPTTVEAANAIDAITTPACRCRNASTSMRDAVKKQQHYVGTSHIVSFVPNIDGEATADVLVEYRYTDGGLVDASGHFVAHEKAHTGVESDFRLVRVGGQWLIDIIESIRAGTPT